MRNLWHLHCLPFDSKCDIDGDECDFDSDATVDFDLLHDDDWGDLTFASTTVDMVESVSTKSFLKSASFNVALTSVSD